MTNAAYRAMLEPDLKEHGLVWKPTKLFSVMYNAILCDRIAMHIMSTSVKPE
jgi:hypothetical protein